MTYVSTSLTLDLLFALNASHTSLQVWLGFLEVLAEFVFGFLEVLVEFVVGFLEGGRIWVMMVEVVVVVVAKS